MFWEVGALKSFSINAHSFIDILLLCVKILSAHYIEYHNLL